MKHTRIPSIQFFVLFLIVFSSAVGRSQSIGKGLQTFIKSQNQYLQSIEEFDTNYQNCSELLRKGDEWASTGPYQKAYDTLKKVVEYCSNIKTGNNYAGAASFIGLDGANASRNGDVNRFVEYREWLKSVLYLCTVPGLPSLQHYCVDAGSIIRTFYYNPGVGTDFKAQMAIYKYIHDSGKCVDTLPVYNENMNYLRGRLAYIYRDSVQDSLKTPLDTTLPNIDDLGLRILRGKEFAGVYGGPEGNRKDYISSFTALSNPFSDEVSLAVNISMPTMLRFDIFDELGRSVYAEGDGFKQAGEYKYVIPAKGWSSGVYYARLGTSGGEVRTVKLIKQ